MLIDEGPAKNQAHLISIILDLKAWILRVFSYAFSFVLINSMVDIPSIRSSSFAFDSRGDGERREKV